MWQAEEAWSEGAASFSPASPAAPGTDIDFQVLCYVRHGEGAPGVQHGAYNLEHTCSSLSWLTSGSGLTRLWPPVRAEGFHFSGHTQDKATLLERGLWAQRMASVSRNPY